MSDTTQYPDGPYLFTGTDQFGWRHEGRIALLENGTLQFVGAEWLCVLRHCDIEEFVPLVPATELDAARQRIAELEAEIERMRQENWVPLEEGEYACPCADCRDMPNGGWMLYVVEETIIGIVCTDDEIDDDRNVDLPPNLRLCKRGDA